MNIKSPTVRSRSSQYIDETIKFIGKIMEKEYGYTSNSCVYFNLSKFYQQHGYLQLPSDRTNDIDVLSAGGALPTSEFSINEKKNQYDLMLWKGADAGEPGFESSWGYGQPNFDIQCMRFDIVTPGLNDQIFKYHNEIGQGEGFLDDVVMNYLIGVGKCTVKTVTRSGLSNNIQDMNYILKEFNITMKHIRLLCLTYPWMSSLTVERSHIDEVKQFDEMLQSFMKNVQKDMKLVDKFELADSFGKLNEKDIDIYEYFRETKKEIHYALCDAIDTSRVMNLFSKLIDKTTKYFYETHEKVNAHLLRNIHELIFKLLNIFGLNYD